ncbi:hypothetical protein ASPCAL09323 [Aspergillus calidoustus]|uniref:Uncharacterized protein n=1 Tax=Aspergillus calidoustus TaxID=454130 RepID=A0A0U5GYQ3_ASPCI|nr:hypothetical protein ASPCAL09323 [Aspergillus calidoustus]
MPTKRTRAGPVTPFTRANNKQGEPIPIPEPRVEEEEEVSDEASTTTPTTTSSSNIDPHIERFRTSAPHPPVPCFQCAMNIFTLKPPNGEISGLHHCISTPKGCEKCKKHNLGCSPLPPAAHREALKISRMPPI